jgi:hypothetical protein
MSDVPVGLPARLKAWPWPALGAWAAGWLLLQASLRWDAGPWLSLALGWLPSLAVAISVRGRWRRVLLIAGWPAILGLAAVAAWPGWVWLALACGVLLFYPLSAWRDAPLFPTPRDALQGLSAHIALPQDARLLDAGSGLGHGLAALRQAFPRARIEGIERSGLLVLASRVRPVAGARVRRGDLWSVSWRDYDLVYLFQRPESMAPAWRKACAEMRPGSWVVSLEFPVPQQAATLELEVAGGAGRRILAYQVGGEAAVNAQPGRSPADNPETRAGPMAARGSLRTDGARRAPRRHRA